MTITQRKPNETFRHFPWKSACMNFVPSRHSQILESIMPFNSQLPRLLVKCSNPRENHDRSIEEKYGRGRRCRSMYFIDFLLGIEWWLDSWTTLIIRSHSITTWTRSLGKVVSRNSKGTKTRQGKWDRIGGAENFLATASPQHRVKVEVAIFWYEELRLFLLAVQGPYIL